MSHNNYKNVKIALKRFLVANVGLDDSQVFRAPPDPDEISKFPVIVIRSATALKTGEGALYNDFQILLGVMTRGQGNTEVVSDELDDLLQLLDTKIEELGAKGLDASLAGTGRWSLFTRVDQQTQFDNIIEDDSGWVVYGARAGVLIREQLPVMSG
jgi:hypothetical protein